jgi:glycerol kinase
MSITEIMSSDSSITPQIMKEEGAMKAYQSVAQSMALAIQDAVDNLRNINTISATAMGVAMAQMLADPATAAVYEPIVTNAQQMSTSASGNFLTIGQNAAAVLNGFPSGQ